MALTWQDNVQHSHVYRIRLDGEGTSAALVEQAFALFTARIQRGLDIPMHVVAQVIELSANEQANQDPTTPWTGSWYRGRLVLAPDVATQGYDEEHGMKLAHGDRSVPAGHVTGDAAQDLPL